LHYALRILRPHLLRDTSAAETASDSIWMPGQRLMIRALLN